MAPSIDQLVDKVFKRTEGNYSSRDMHTFNVLQAIDGKRSVGTIAQQDHYELEDLATVIGQLVDEGVIEPIHIDGSKTVGADFFKEMEARLGRIMGPVSGIIIDEQINELGIDTANYPVSKAHELIELISRSIPDKSESEAFIRNMTDQLDD